VSTPVEFSAPAEWPTIAVIIPVLNEERHLADVVAKVLAQDYPKPFKLALALGPSTDGTDNIAAALAAGDSRVVLVPNPSGLIPKALNLALAATDSEVVVRCDGHAEFSDGYIRTAVAALLRLEADAVGGVMAAEGQTDFEVAVATAMTSTIGVGAAAFHVGGQEQESLTAYLGVYRRAALEAVGGYDESYLRAEDWEMNHRIRSQGGRIWFVPDLRVTYRPRPSVERLASQYFYYGRWRRQVMRDHRETISLRYLAPPVALVGVVGGTAVGVAGVVGLVVSGGASTWAKLGLLGFAAPLGYAAIIGAASLKNRKGLSAPAKRSLPIVYATMHLAWGYGFITSPKDLRAQAASGTIRG
jgi:cellulose synthase/poly-beta-1,6-N-acetylglucosamine synthase-like glycosyltransferase